MVRIISTKLQPPQPEVDTDRELADHDLKYLVDFLSTSRSTRYELIERPDEKVQGRPAPDYLLRESPTGRIIAVEHTLLMDEDVQRSVARRMKAGAEIVTVGPKTIDPREIGQALHEAVARKLARGQLNGVAADERILLMRNRIFATAKTYLGAQLNFTFGDRTGIDSAYLIASRHLLELW